MRVHLSKLAIGGVVIACAAVYLGLTAANSGWVYYVEVDQLSQAYPGTHVRVHGTVSPDSLDLRPEDPSAAFTLVGLTQSVPVRYRGPIPPMLTPGSQVVAQGALDDQGVFIADTILTKCASKYQAPGDPPAAETRR